MGICLMMQFTVGQIWAIQHANIILSGICHIITVPTVVFFFVTDVKRARGM